MNDRLDSFRRLPHVGEKAQSARGARPRIGFLAELLDGEVEVREERGEGVVDRVANAQVGAIAIVVSTEFGYGADAGAFHLVTMSGLSLRPELTVGSACRERGIYTLRAELALSGTPSPS